MKRILNSILAVVLVGASWGLCAQDNQLTEKEVEQGWELLFDGRDLGKWRNFKKPGLSKQWQAVDGEMVLTEGGGGDILTKKTYRDFDLKLEWKISLAGNSGIFVLADELGSQIYSHALEVQVLDNERHADNKVASHLSGSIYDLIASPKNSHRPVGAWNQVRILLEKKHLQVWQNGYQTVDILIGGEEWDRLVENSKFRDWQGFAKGDAGHIGLQDHGDSVAFKNIKIKEI
ncbi:DUF1080 domain-containing protein [Microbulbifer sp. TYP-18]|uniref:DUF1080 domain-containing protein n=1 Tax=Microbulbifer sp. TYP-18 TaxID=3230024 RepID=UPI0034C64A99